LVRRVGKISIILSLIFSQPPRSLFLRFAPKPGDLLLLSTNKKWAGLHGTAHLALFKRGHDAVRENLPGVCRDSVINNVFTNAVDDTEQGVV